MSQMSDLSPENCSESRSNRVKNQTQRIRWCASLAITFWLAFANSASAQLRFYTQPYHCFSGDAVRFIYFESTDTVAKANIALWAWDFDGNGTFDAQGTSNNISEI